MAKFRRSRSGEHSNALRESEIKTIITAGVAAETMQRVMTRALEDIELSGVRDVEQRWKIARNQTQKALRDPILRDTLDVIDRKRVADCLAWMGDQRCHKEPLLARVLTHMFASFLVGLIGFLLLVIVNTYGRLHHDDVAVQASAEVAGEAIALISPEVGSPPALTSTDTHSSTPPITKGAVPAH